MTDRPFSLTDAELIRQIEHSLRTGENAVGAGNQGAVFLYERDGQKLLVKAATGKGPLFALRQRMLRREYDVQQRLAGVEGVPVCYGMLEDRFLLREYVDGVIFRHAQFSDRDAFFEKLWDLLTVMHERGVAHSDLKRKENILVTPDEQPVLIDLGMSVLLRDGVHPFNRIAFDWAARMDRNAWAKHKYFGRYDRISGPDLERYDPTLPERVAKVRPRFRHFRRTVLPRWWADVKERITGR